MGSGAESFGRVLLPMLKISDLAPLFLEACPEARPAWQELQHQWQGHPPLYFLEVASFSNHLLDCYERSRFEELKRAFEVVELFMTEGDEAACQLVVTGLLEKLQNIAGAKEYGYKVFDPYLRRRSLMAWDELALEREYRKQEAGLL
jgi:hypothetical protein